MQTTGILFDTAYIEPDIHVWIRSDAGEFHHAQTPYHPLFYLTGPRPSLDRAADLLRNSGSALPAEWTERTEFWSGESILALAVRAMRPGHTVHLARRLLHQDHRLRAYDVDIDPRLSFHSAHDLFPLARIDVGWEPAGDTALLTSIRSLDDPWDPHYVVPDLLVMRWSLAESERIPLGEGNAVRMEWPGGAEVVPTGSVGAIHRIFDLVHSIDPDVIVSGHGDEYIMPWLLENCAQHRIPFGLDRMAPVIQRRVRRDGRAIHVYSGLIYKAPDYPLLGRWHLDLGNSFFAGHSGLEGVLEMARLSRLPVQLQARRSGGAAITAMEIHLALKRRILVPFVKDQVEGYRAVGDLLKADRGSITFYPPVGLHENVIEVDYQQMYPSLMDVHNISPEAMNCSCCPGIHPVPGTSHHTCTRRRGLVPDALAGLLAKRLRYKAILKECPPEDRPRYDSRATALKWTLVTTFGYQGFKSAKFGLIEAHEGITAWGRESLLVAKEIFEAAGFRILHGLTDSLYLQKADQTEAEVLALCRQVNQETGLSLALEGVYDWICFLPSKTHQNLSVATRYFGRFQSGELKIRGIKTRQHSTPRFFHEAQQHFLRIMQGCRDGNELRAAVPRLRDAYRAYVRQLWSGTVRADDLALMAQVSQDVRQYRSNSPSAVVLRVLQSRGVRIPAGQTVRYVIVDRKNPDPLRRYLPEPFLEEMLDYDARSYEALLWDVYQEVALHVDCERHNSGKQLSASL